MTREELKRHCLKQIESCEMWASHRREEPHGKIYEEHKLILELLEQEDNFNKIITEIKQYQSDYDKHGTNYDRTAWKTFNKCLQIIDKHKANLKDIEADRIESEDENGRYRVSN